MTGKLQLYSNNPPPGDPRLYGVSLISRGTDRFFYLVPPTARFFEVTRTAFLLLRLGRKASVLLWGLRLDSKVNRVKGAKFFVKRARFQSKGRSFGWR